MKKKKRTKADIKKRELSNCSFVILDKEGKPELEIEEGKIKKTRKDSEFEKGENIMEEKG